MLLFGKKFYFRKPLLIFRFRSIKRETHLFSGIKNIVILSELQKCPKIFEVPLAITVFTKLFQITEM